MVSTDPSRFLSIHRVYSPNFSRRICYDESDIRRICRVDVSFIMSGSLLKDPVAETLGGTYRCPARATTLHHRAHFPWLHTRLGIEVRPCGAVLLGTQTLRDTPGDYTGTQSISDIGSFLCWQIIVKEKGIFTNVSSASAKSKLRVLFEVAPLGFLIEKAGGHSSDGTQSVLDKVINALDERTQVAYGSKNEINRFEETLYGSSRLKAGQPVGGALISKFAVLLFYMSTLLDMEPRKFNNHIHNVSVKKINLYIHFDSICLFIMEYVC
ncbi:hypothetical protein KSP40_PGU003474 [Platanthera guangdongensis]|uniref:Fructose-1-6-bisphosphatase class 1 C-terminal domain-containing protein n=1 Tax=Platanthera guangdongensis TaxID=2320717 RepID=A0ABR2MQ87_9ASPA